MEKLELQKRVKEFRNRKGFSQEELAEKTGLSLRTIQRIENGETIPRGDTLKKLSIALQISPDEIIDWQAHEDNNILVMLSFCQLGYIAFPLLGIIIPLAIWMIKKDKVRYVDEIGKQILNFQITWTISLFVFLYISVILVGFSSTFVSTMSLFYVYNFVMIIWNTILLSKKKSKLHYFPSIKFLS